jgi:PAS domain S-box-containing protein
MNHSKKSKADLISTIESLEKEIERLNKVAPDTDYKEKNRRLQDEVSDLKKREADLVFEEQLLNTLMEHIPDSIYFKNTKSNFIRVNKAWANRRWLSDPEEVVGKTDFDFFPKELAKSFYEDEQDIITSGKPLVSKIEKIQLPGMEPRWISITKIPIIDKKTRTIIGTCGISHDISHATKMEEELDRERDMFRLLMDNSPDNIYFKGLDSRFSIVNKSQAKLMGLINPADAIGKTDSGFFEHAQDFLNDEQTILKTGKGLIGKIEKVIRLDGTFQWYSSTKIPIFDKSKKMIGMFGISRDITKIKEYEEELQKAKEELTSERDMLHLLLDHSPDSIYFKDKESRFLRISKAQAEKFNISSPEEALGKTDFDFFGIGHSQEAYDDERNIITTGKPIVGKIECETAPGEPEHWVFTTKAPIYDKNNTVVGTFGISRDITEVKMFEKALSKAKDELEARVQERTEDLQKANKSLEARIEQLDFLTSVSYDMAQCINIDELVPVILRSFVIRYPEAVASCCLRTNKGFSCIAATGLLNCDIGKMASEKALNVFHHMPLQRPFIVENWPSDDYINQFSWPQTEGLPFYCAIPLLADNQLIAIIQIFACGKGQAVYKEEEQVVATLATQAAVSLSNALHYQDLGEKARLQGELDAARSIQQRLTPSHKPSIPCINLKGVYYPAFEVGGDYLDYFKTEAGNWVIVIADVCGKGIPAALLMTMLRSAFRVEARNETSAKRLLCAVNDSMRVNLDDRSFVTAICLIVNEHGSGMSYARAGHPKLIRINAGSNTVETIESNGIALGFISEFDAFSGFIDEVSIPLKEGDRYLIYTDGLTEAVDNDKNAYKTKRLLDLLSTNIGITPEAMLESIMNDVKVFTNGAPYHDDLTIIALQVIGERRE